MPRPAVTRLQNKLRRQIAKLEAELAPLPGLRPALEKKERIVEAQALAIKVAQDAFEPFEMRGDRFYHTAVVTGDMTRLPEALACYEEAYAAAEVGGLHEQMKRLAAKALTVESKLRGLRR